jgi:hypothetical protein
MRHKSFGQNIRGLREHDRTGIILHRDTTRAATNSIGYILHILFFLAFHFGGNKKHRSKNVTLEPGFQVLPSCSKAFVKEKEKPSPHEIW